MSVAAGAKVVIGNSKEIESTKIDDSVTFGADVDKEQIRMLAEECILVDANDKVTGHASKKVCHLMSNIKKGLLHRAFSVFLFNTKGELLLQQRSAEKITFPLRWTNTCCSHPLYTAPELEEKNAMGVRRAAQRKLEHELGIDPKEMPLEKLHFLTRIHYEADSDGTQWGEHEVDWILFAKVDVQTKVNLNEVAAVQYVTPTQLKQIFADAKTSKTTVITPWFEHIANQFLFSWWDKLDTIIADGGLGAAEAAKVHKM